MPNKLVSQKRFVKGLNAATGVLSQQPGALTRMSNLLMTQRGSLQTCDGTKGIAQVSATYKQVLVLQSFANLVNGQFAYYCALALNPIAQLTNVTGFTATPVNGAGVNNPSGHYFFGIVATIGSAHSDINPTFLEMSTVVPFDGVSFSWSSVANATGYSIYLFIPNNAVNVNQWQVALVQSVGAVTSYTFTGVLPVTPAISAPAGNTSYLQQLFTGSVPTGGSLTFNAVTAGSFASTTILPASLTAGDPEFNSSVAVPGFSPYGGVATTACIIPDIVQFAALSILALGNGQAPASYDPSKGTSASVSALANSFQATYPAWQASVAWIAGDQIVVNDAGTNYLFQASQGGTSGATAPAWVFTKGAYTAEGTGSVQWLCQGPLAAGVAPRGAAHAVAYAGSLWLANTSPQTTSDQLDGPTVLKMSDANNPNSWNPVNTAFIGRDDGTQITGLSTFTIAAVGISPVGSLAVFKEYETYQVIGVFGSSDFEIQPAQTDMGCLAARSIQFIPGFGVVRYTHLGFAVYNGVGDRLISEEIRPYLFGGIDVDSDITPIDPAYAYLSKSSQSVIPPMYMCAMPLMGGSGALTRLFCYDLIMKAWVIMDLPWAITALNRVKAGEGNPLVIAGRASDGSLQRMQCGDASWDVGGSSPSAINWSFRAPDIYGEGSSERVFYRQFVVRGWGSPSSIVAALNLDGASQGNLVADIVPQPGNQFEARFRVMLNGQIAHLDISGSGQVVIDSVDWTIVPKAETARRVFA